MLHPLSVQKLELSSNANMFIKQVYGKKGKRSPYLITERRVLELIPVLDSQPACDTHNRLMALCPGLPG